MTRIAEVRRQMDAARHPALPLVHTISSLGSIDYRHDDWGVDVTIGCSEKGLMLPPGLGFNAISEKALAATQVRDGCLAPTGTGIRCFETTRPGFFPYTRRQTCCTACGRRSEMFEDEGLENVLARHDALRSRHARARCDAWGLDIVRAEPRGVQRAC